MCQPVHAIIIILALLVVPHDVKSLTEVELLAQATASAAVPIADLGPLFEAPSAATSSDASRSTAGKALLLSNSHLSGLEAAAFSRHWLASLLPLGRNVSWELQQPEAFWAIQATRRLARLLPTDNMPQADMSLVGPALKDVATTVAGLCAAACGPPNASIPEPLYSAYPMTRRVLFAALHALQHTTTSAQVATAVAQAGRETVRSFSRIATCAKRRRPITEFFQVARSGGTSVSNLATLANHTCPAAPAASSHLRRGMVDSFNDWPRWNAAPPWLHTALTEGQPQNQSDCRVMGLLDCSGAPARTQCSDRSSFLQKHGLSFYINHGVLHEGVEGLTSHTCPQFQSLMILRSPVRRTSSNVLDIIDIYDRAAKKCVASASRRAAFALPRNSTAFWRQFAPAAMDNLFVRSLLGHSALCRRLGSLGGTDLRQAQLRLLSFDHLALLGRDALNDVIFRLGMGWPHALPHRKSREWDEDAAAAAVDAGLGKDMAAQLKELNRLDERLVLLATVALKLDASFLATAAWLENRTRPASPPPIASHSITSRTARAAAEIVLPPAPPSWTLPSLPASNTWWLKDSPDQSHGAAASEETQPRPAPRSAAAPAARVSAGGTEMATSLLQNDDQASARTLQASVSVSRAGTKSGSGTGSRTAGSLTSKTSGTVSSTTRGIASVASSSVIRTSNTRSLRRASTAAADYNLDGHSPRRSQGNAGGVAVGGAVSLKRRLLDEEDKWLASSLLSRGTAGGSGLLKAASRGGAGARHVGKKVQDLYVDRNMLLFGVASDWPKDQHCTYTAVIPAVSDR